MSSTPLVRRPSFSSHTRLIPRVPVIASAAVPGILNPVVLMTKTKDGVVHPWEFQGKHKDGSLRVDIPLRASLLRYVDLPLTRCLFQSRCISSTTSISPSSRKSIVRPRLPPSETNTHSSRSSHPSFPLCTPRCPGTTRLASQRQRLARRFLPQCC